MGATCKFHLLECVYTQGAGTANEDAFGITGQCAFVIDGATTLGRGATTESGGRLLAEALRDALLADEAKGRGPFDAWLNRAAEGARRRLDERDGDTTAAARASAAGAIVRAGDGSNVEYRLFGDCVVVAGRAGTPCVYRDDRLGALDAVAVGMMADLVSSGRSPKEAREEVLPALERHRAMLNHPDGYPSLTLDGGGIYLARGGFIDVRRNPRVVLASDGFVDAVELFRVTTWAKVIEGSISLADTESLLRKAQAGDADLRNYPRLKLADDATAVLFEVQHSTEC